MNTNTNVALKQQQKQKYNQTGDILNNKKFNKRQTKTIIAQKQIESRTDTATTTTTQ